MFHSLHAKRAGCIERATSKRQHPTQKIYAQSLLWICLANYPVRIPSDCSSVFRCRLRLYLVAPGSLAAPSRAMHFIAFCFLWRILFWGRIWNVERL